MTDSEALHRLLDLEAIRTLKHRYVRCMTQSRWDEMATLLTPDVQTAYSDGKYSFDNRDDLLGFLRGTHDVAQSHVLAYWHVTMPEINLISATQATGVWAMYHFYLDKPALQQQEMFAYYEDTYRKVGDVWLIASTGYRRVMEQTFSRRDLPSMELVAG
jgi:hypothetical protein